MVEARAACRRIERGERGFPAALERHFQASPAFVDVLGNTRLLREPLVALFCSERAPPGCVIVGMDLVRSLAESGAVLLGGFHSAVERECLTAALAAGGRAVVCPARGIASMRLPRAWRRPEVEGRLLVLSGSPERLRRPTATVAAARNRMVAALAERIILLHATPGGRLVGVVGESMRAGVPVYCPGLPENRDLLLMGARPLEDALRG